MKMAFQLIFFTFFFTALIFSSLPSNYAHSHYPIDIGPAMVRNLDKEFQDSNTIPGISHITVAGAVLHGFNEIEVWMETAAPGGSTPVHRHACEEVFVVLKGSGTLYVASNASDSDGGKVFPGRPETMHFSVNSTFHVAPDVVHQVLNTDPHQDLHLLVVVSKPPIKVMMYEDWTTPHNEAQLMNPFVWDARYVVADQTSSAQEI
ncbi:auxin-binding protein T85-like [Andrographis paniculata]|uniref:auxin-binding protein T85-like n=1 Tax=Andrographis paniculata TaxID=175694 RepID=UPI0021E82244|nr:auxin-binding protein T85-like [Andrographis paniculata]